MSMKFKRVTEGKYQDANSRNRLLGHLSDASKSVPDLKHAVHSFLKKAASEIGASPISDRSEDGTELPSDFTSPGNVSAPSLRAPSNEPAPISTSPSSRARGSSGPIPGPGGYARSAANEIFRSLASQGDPTTLALRRQKAVVEIYAKAAKWSTGSTRQSLEAVAKELENIPLSASGEVMSEMDVRALKGEFGPEATQAAMRKAQATAIPLQELGEGASKGDRRSFAGRHGF